MSKSVISIGSNFEPTHNIRRALEALEVEAVSRVFLTSAQPPATGVFHNLVVVAAREYGQAELRELERSIGRRRGDDATSRVPIDLDLQFSGEWENVGLEGRFSIEEPHRMDWAKDFFVRLPTVDLISTVIPPAALCSPGALINATEACREQVLGAFPVDRMPLLEGGLMAHKQLMAGVLEFLKSEWKPEDYPGAAAIVLNGAPVAVALLFRGSDYSPASRAEPSLALEALKQLGPERLGECLLYSTHEPCPATLARCRSLGIRGLIWAADAADAPELYRDDRTNTLAACRGEGAPLVYRGVLREEVLEFSRLRVKPWPASRTQDGTDVPDHGVQGALPQLSGPLHFVPRRKPAALGHKPPAERAVSTQELYDAAAHEYLDAEAHPVATSVACIQWHLRTQLARESSGRIIDIGCGSELPPVVGRFYGVDFSPNQVAERRRKAPCEFSLIGDAHSLPFGDDVFGALFAGNMLDHMRSLEDAADEFARVLAPGGKAVITLLSPDSLPDDLYGEGTMRFQTLDGETYTTPITRWSTTHIRESFGRHFEVTEEPRMQVGIREFSLSVFSLTKRP